MEASRNQVLLPSKRIRGSSCGLLDGLWLRTGAGILRVFWSNPPEITALLLGLFCITEAEPQRTSQGGDTTIQETHRTPTAAWSLIADLWVSVSGRVQPVCSGPQCAGRNRWGFPVPFLLYRLKRCPETSMAEVLGFEPWQL